ncbi:aminotransferase class I/II-fold pyridoxal phosphate-dependent enzyme [Saccharicrinis aurantiacus]|uniref:aminotransferase class I/II-fold pyridoxal phosphate-dependent enzyme n=1 Tax=Saccharicrinis aurantiacus TaxID=1849719 RepID=UPI00094FDE77|nr:pyridoxal phosphate-dependent aminotransferase [Saccharicrinis aurantiacus]
MQTPISNNIINEALQKFPIQDMEKATIREIVTLVNYIENKTKQRFIRMEMGVPGLPPSRVGIKAEIDALKKGVASKYPMLDGIEEYKFQASRFVKAFMNINIDPEGCIPTVGTMQGAYACFMAIGHINPKKDTFLFLDPGFPVQKQQLNVQGFKHCSFDIYEYRGHKLEAKLENILSKGNINSIIYSNPNNPTWMCLHDDELEIIGKLATKYDVIVIEDLAYFGMDNRIDISIPYQEPYQATVAKYTNNYLLLISSSKVFSYAGQRIGTLCISNTLYNRYFESLKLSFGIGNFGRVIIGRILYSLSSGASHSAQYAIAAIYKAACNGTYNFLEEVKEYSKRAILMKQIFIDNGFTIVYDYDVEEEIADGFYFTIAYPGFTGGALLKELLHFGVSAITLGNTGSCKQGLRACVSQTQLSRLTVLSDRLEQFNRYCTSKIIRK